jgi:hypothetical protein
MVIDLQALEAAAFSENGAVAVVERRWLMDVFHALQGAAFRADNVELRRKGDARITRAARVSPDSEAGRAMRGDAQQRVPASATA